MKTLHFTFTLLTFLLFFSCSNAQKADELGVKVIPGSKELKAKFFNQPFHVKGIINQVSNKGKSSVFRYVEKHMVNTDYENKKAINQILTYLDKDKKATGIHTTYYDSETLEVIYWQYDNKGNNTSFAFKTDGTKIKGTQDLSIPEDKWQGMNIGTKVFQNESRELFFRALDVPLGTTVSFPVIGMQPPFHGWVSYTYAKNKKVNYEGKDYDAKIWESAIDPETFYVVITEAPYVIKRVVKAGKEKHVFTYGNVKT